MTTTLRDRLYNEVVVMGEEGSFTCQPPSLSVLQQHDTSGGSCGGAGEERGGVVRFRGEVKQLGTHLGMELVKRRLNTDGVKNGEGWTIQKTHQLIQQFISTGMLHLFALHASLDTEYSFKSSRQKKLVSRPREGSRN